MAATPPVLKRVFGMLAGCSALLDPRAAGLDQYMLDGKLVAPRGGSLIGSEDGSVAFRRNTLGNWVPVHPVVVPVNPELRIQKWDSPELYFDQLDRPVDLIFEGVLAKDDQTPAGLRLRINGDHAFTLAGNLTTAAEEAISGDLRLEERRFGDSDDTGGMVASLTHGMALIDSGGETLAGGMMPFHLKITIDPVAFDHDNKKFWILAWSMVYPRNATATGNWPACQVDGKFYVKAVDGNAISTIGIESGVVDIQGPTFIASALIDGASGSRLRILFR